ncbi:MAG: patatin family protein [Eggerthellaceae bacterium]|jgi:predicted patatin/cPLA2 family phospholipase
MESSGVASAAEGVVSRARLLLPPALGGAGNPAGAEPLTSTEMSLIVRQRMRAESGELHRAATADIAPNVCDTALIIEGGGMRDSYSAGAVVALLEQNINFADVYGISAGSSHAVDYLSRDPLRVKQSFVDVAMMPGFRSTASLLLRRGYFNAEYLYEGIAQEMAGSNSEFSFDWDTFVANRANVHIDAFDATDGTTVTWSKSDMPTLRDLMLRVRASSTMPLFMPRIEIDGHRFADGGLGRDWGLQLHSAQRDGYERFFIVRSRPRGFRMKQPTSTARRAVTRALHSDPLVAQRTLDRWEPYNALCDEVDELERCGRACVFYADDVSASSLTTNLARLQANYQRGYLQAQRELPQWRKFLGI